MAASEEYRGQVLHSSPFRNMSQDISPEWTDPQSSEGARMMRRVDHVIIII
jgi:hypothetical protein